MKKLFTLALILSMVMLLAAPSLTHAQSGTLVVYATNPDHSANKLNDVITKDTLTGGAQAHAVYSLVSLDTTYTYDQTILVKSDIAIIGVLGANIASVPNSGRPPCIQPQERGDNSLPAILFQLNGNNTNVQLKNLYLLGISIHNAINYGTGQGVQVAADNVTLRVDNVIFEQQSQYCIAYSGNMDKFFITNCKFRNGTTNPGAYYISEALRNNGVGSTDTTIMRYNTIFCFGGYATAATHGIITYYEFRHNDIIHTYKNPWFFDRMSNAKIDDNVFYDAYMGGQSRAEYLGWDSFTPSNGPSIILTGPLDSATAAILLGHAITNAADTAAAEAARKVEVKNNVYFWPSTLTNWYNNAGHTGWNDTATVDSIYTAVWMNAQTVTMFSDKTHWPNFAQSANVSMDPVFGASIPAVLTATSGSGGDGVNLLNWNRKNRDGTGTTETWGYQLTQVGTAANWVPTWPLPEATDMKYTGSLPLGQDGRPLGDPYWFNQGPTGVTKSLVMTPKAFSLSEAYPNPFNPSTHIQYTLASAGVTSLRVYNLLGQVVSTIVDNVSQNAGTYNVTVDMSHATSGVYFYILEQGGNHIAHKMLLLK